MQDIYGLESAGAGFAQNFIGGQLAAKKAKLLDEELRSTQLEREEFEATRALRELARQHGLKLQEAQIAREDAARDLDAFQLNLARQMAPIQVSEAKSRSGRAKTELKSAKLEQEEFEATRTLRDLARQHGIKLQEAQIAREGAARNLDAFQLNLAQQMAPSQVSEAKSRSGRAETEAKSAKLGLRYMREDRPNQQRILASEATRSEALGSEARTRALSSALGVDVPTGAVPNREITEADAMNYANMAIGLLNISDGPEKPLMLNAYAQKYLGEVQAKKLQLSQNQQILKERDLEQTNKVADAAAVLAQKGPAGVEGARILYGQNHPVYLAAKQMFEIGLPETGRTVDPIELSAAQQRDRTIGEINSAEGKELAKELGLLRSSLAKKQTELSSLKGEETSTVGQFLRTVAPGRNQKSLIKDKTKEIKDLESQIAPLQDRLKELTGSGGSGGSDVILAIQDHLSKAGSGVSPKATDEDLRKLAKYLNEQGIPATVEILKSMQKRSK